MLRHWQKLIPTNAGLLRPNPFTNRPKTRIVTKRHLELEYRDRGFISTKMGLWLVLHPYMGQYNRSLPRLYRYIFYVTHNIQHFWGYSRERSTYDTMGRETYCPYMSKWRSWDCKNLLQMHLKQNLWETQVPLTDLPWSYPFQLVTMNILEPVPMTLHCIQFVLIVIEC